MDFTSLRLELSESVVWYSWSEKATLPDMLPHVALAITVSAPWMRNGRPLAETMITMITRKFQNHWESRADVSPWLIRLNWDFAEWLSETVQTVSDTSHALELLSNGELSAFHARMRPFWTQTNFHPTSRFRATALLRSLFRGETGARWQRMSLMCSDQGQFPQFLLCEPFPRQRHVFLLCTNGTTMFLWSDFLATGARWTISTSNASMGSLTFSPILLRYVCFSY